MAQIDVELPWRVEAMLLCMANGTWLPPEPPEMPWLAATRTIDDLLASLGEHDNKGDEE